MSYSVWCGFLKSLARTAWEPVGKANTWHRPFWPGWPHPVFQANCGCVVPLATMNLKLQLLELSKVTLGGFHRKAFSSLNHTHSCDVTMSSEPEMCSRMSFLGSPATSSSLRRLMRVTVFYYKGMHTHVIRAGVPSWVTKGSKDLEGAVSVRITVFSFEAQLTTMECIFELTQTRGSTLFLIKLVHKLKSLYFLSK